MLGGYVLPSIFTATLVKDYMKMGGCIYSHSSVFQFVQVAVITAILASCT